jgi:hypothetical protein
VGKRVRKLHSAESIIEISHLANLLAAAGIACQIRNDQLVGAVGEIPFVECWPEIWLLDARDARRAEELIHNELNRPASPQLPWQCPDCGETIEGQFAACWRCAGSGIESQ